MTDQTRDILQEISTQVSQNDVFLYMKGSHDMPMCGFSSVIVQILNKLNIEFKDVDVLQDQEIREGIKKFSNWPTIPQLYVKGEFIGGCDITKELYESGELVQFLQNKGITIQAN